MNIRETREKGAVLCCFNLNFNYGFRKGGKNQRKHHPFFSNSHFSADKRVMTCVDTAHYSLACQSGVNGLLLLCFGEKKIDAINLESRAKIEPECIKCVNVFNGSTQ